MSKYIRPDGVLDLERKYNNPFTGKPQPKLPSGSHFYLEKRDWIIKCI